MYLHLVWHCHAMIIDQCLFSSMSSFCFFFHQSILLFFIRFPPPSPLSERVWPGTESASAEHALRPGFPLAAHNPATRPPPMRRPRRCVGRPPDSCGRRRDGFDSDERDKGPATAGLMSLNDTYAEALAIATDRCIMYYYLPIQLFDK